MLVVRRTMTMPPIASALLVLLLRLFLRTAAAGAAVSSSAAAFVFVPQHHNHHHRPVVQQQQRTRRPPPPPLSSYSDDNNGNNENDSNMDNTDGLRRLLEASWNAESMGRVPTTPAQAAQACAGSLRQAVEKKNAGKNRSGGVYLVDLRLPQYDISAGPNLYDEVLAVEFCTSLAAQLASSSSDRGDRGRGGSDCEILVRDAKVLHTVTRVLNAREGITSSSSSSTAPPIQQKPTAPAEPETTKSQAPTQAEDTEFFDDFADFGTIGGGGSSGDDDPSPAPQASSSSSSSSSSSIESGDDFSVASSKDVGSSSSDVDSFRAQLDRTFYSSDSVASSSEIAEEERLLDKEEASSTSSSEWANKRPSASNRRAEKKRYRLASLLGDATISSGPDMVDHVVAAVSAHAKPTETEDTVIVLSPASREEMVAIRALVASYRATKTIVLVNCQLEPPLPRELMGAETVYSVLPLIAKPTASTSNDSNSKNAAADAAPSTRVVVLRRYPRDWEVYVDVGNGRGFDLAASVPDGSVPGKQGPTMEWISAAVKRYLQSNV